MTLTCLTAFRRTTHLAIAAALTLAWEPATLHATYLTSFEAPDYASGSLVGQDSWSGGAAPRVQTAAELATELTAAGLNPADAVHSGAQAVIATGTGGSSSTVRPVSGLASASQAVLDVWARPLTPGASGSTVGTNVGNIFMTMEDSAGTRAAAFRFGAAVDMGTITSTSIDVYSEAAGWTSTGVQWQPDVWYHVRLTADYSTKTYDISIDGAVALTDVPFYAAGSAELSQIRIFRGSGQAGMIIDDVSVIPEPSAQALSLAAATLGCLCGRIRRPKRLML